MKLGFVSAILPELSLDRPDAPDALESALRNAPPGSTVDGAVYWDVYRALVTNVVLYNPQTGVHLAQWNIWQPGAPLP